MIRKKVGRLPESENPSRIGPGNEPRGARSDEILASARDLSAGPCEWANTGRQDSCETVADEDGRNRQNLSFSIKDREVSALEC